jgi:type III secretion system FlhB-like substrate exporter
VSLKRAVALRYDEEADQAPVVVSSGEGDLADRIEQAAVAYGVPVVRDRPLAEALGELEAGTEIPEALYEAVAALLREIAAETLPVVAGSLHPRN